MPITLNGVELPEGLVWQERYQPQRLKQVVKPTIGGGEVVFVGPHNGSRNMTLSSLEDQGWILKEVLEQIYEFAESLGATYTMNYHGEVFTVAFRHHEPPAIESVPLITRGLPLDGDYFGCVLKLMIL